MAKKAPRRTAQRILEVTLDLFNRFGEPNVSTTLISAELRISPGNLYYHYPAKDALINTLFDQYEAALNELLQASDSVHNVEDAWFFLHTLFELIWQYRFLYRDLNDLLSKNRRLETHLQAVLQREMAHKMGDIGTAVAAVSVRQGDEDLDGRCVGGRCVGVARLHAADAGNDDTRTPPSETQETALEAHAPAAQRSLLHDADELLLVPSPSPMAVYQVHQVHRRRPETD